MEIPCLTTIDVPVIPNIVYWSTFKMWYSS